MKRNHLTKSQRQYILREMIELARYLTVENVPPPQIRDAVKRLRDDLLMLLRAGSTDITVDKESYLPSPTDQEKHMQREVPIEQVATPEGTHCQHCGTLQSVSSFDFRSGENLVVRLSYCHTCWLLTFGYLGSSLGIDLSPVFTRKTTKTRGRKKERSEGNI